MTIFYDLTVDFSLLNSTRDGQNIHVQKQNNKTHTLNNLENRWTFLHCQNKRKFAQHLVATDLDLSLVFVQPFNCFKTTVKRVKIGHSKKDRNRFSRRIIALMQVKSIAECSNTFDLH